MTEAETVVEAFNAAINERDLVALAALMTETHRFVDPSGETVDGKESCLAAWRGLFEGFPDYRNVFENLVDTGGGIVVARGRSACSFAPLDGPAAWRAVVVDARVDVWQVSERGPHTA